MDSVLNKLDVYKAATKQTPPPEAPATSGVSAEEWQQVTMHFNSPTLIVLQALDLFDSAAPGDIAMKQN